MPDKWLVDSSVFISSFLEEEEFHRDSLACITAIRTAVPSVRLVIPRIILIEVINGLQKRTGQFQEAEAFLMMADQDSHTQILELDVALQRAAYVLLPKLSLRTLDLLIAVSAIISRSALLSWDKKLLDHCSPFIPTFSPRELLKEIEEN